jgi:hypothetical protein
MKRQLVYLFLIVAVLAACSTPGGPVEVTLTPAPPPTATPPPATETPVIETPAADEAQPAVRAAIEALAASLAITLEQIRVVSVEAVEWPDGCLGVHRPDVMCTMAIVPGYRIVLEANGAEYVYHTNLDGSALTPAGQPALEVPADLIEAARLRLAQALGVAVEAVSVFNAVPVEWPDSCLGLALPGVMCAEVITPGYLIELEAGGEVFGYHANADGSVLRPGSLVLTWEREGGIAGFCDSLAVFRSGEIEGGDCKLGSGAAREGLLTAEERAQLEALLAEYGSVVVDDSSPPDVSDGMSVRLVLYGQGTAQPDEGEAQAITAWAQDLHNRLNQ